jgi:hypothetical protein
MSNAMASVVGAFANRKFSINRNTGVPRERRFSLGEPNATGEFGRCWLSLVLAVLAIRRTTPAGPLYPAIV